MPIFDQPGGLGASTLTERDQPLGQGGLEDLAARLRLQHEDPAAFLKLRQLDIENRIRASHAESQARTATVHEQNQALETFKVMLGLAQEGYLNVDKVAPALAASAQKSGLNVTEENVREMFSQTGNTTLALTNFQQQLNSGMPRNQAALDTLTKFPASKTVVQLFGTEAIKGPEAKGEAITPSANVFAIRLFGKPMNALTPEEKQRAAKADQIFKEVGPDIATILLGKGIYEPGPKDIEAARQQARKEKPDLAAQVAGAVTMAQVTAKQNAPLGSKELTQMVNLQGQSPLSIPGQELSPKALRASGFRYLPEDRIKSFQSGLIALTQINRLEKMGLPLFRGIKPGENLGNALALNGKKVLGEANVRGFEALVLETLPSNAIASGLTPGRIGERLIETIEKPIMPNLTDTEASFKQKISILKQRLKNNTEVHFGLGIKADLVSESTLFGAAPVGPITIPGGKRLTIPTGVK